MKELIIAFVAVLVVTCLLNSINNPNPPYPLGVSVGVPSASTLGTKRDEGEIPEIKYTTNPSRSNKFITGIETKSDERNVEYPLGANN